MKYKAIFCDYDGTLYGTDHTLSLTNIQAIKQYEANGGKFVISTGRLFASIYPHTQKIGLSGDIITTQGAEIYDIDSKQSIWSKLFEINQAVEALRYCEQDSNSTPMIYVGNDCYAQFENEYTHIFAQITGLNLVYTNSLLSEFITINKIRPSKVLALIADNKIEDFMDEGRQVLGENYEICKSQSFLVEILKSGINKGSAVKYLCQKYGLKLDDIICIGDSENDCSMIKIAGLGIAVDNAYDSVKAVAKYISESNDDNAVAKIIERFCL